MGLDMPQDFQLSDHFSFFELTHTSQSELQDKNRIEALNFTNYLKALAQHMERVREALGEPINVHSAFRCDAVNGGTQGSSKTSQHMMGQAMDFTVPSYVGSEASFDAMFERVLGFLKESRLPFGQLLREQAERSYGVARWLHLSLGAPYRDPARCGEVLDAKLGTDGRFLYTMLERVPQPEV